MNRLKNIMSLRSVALSLMLGLTMLLVAEQSSAQVTAASGNASVAMLAANRSNIFTINWQVQSTTDRFSSQAVVANAAPPMVLAGAITPAGVSYSESFQVSGAQVQAWLDAGLNAIVIRRHFTTVGSRVGSGVNADVTLRLTSSGLRSTRELNLFAVQRMQLSFENQTNLIVVGPAEALKAFLDVNYSGSGVLEGTWQVAEPGSTEGLPLYRTLRLMKQTLNSAQQARIQSPALPTDRPGKYLLRFCLVDRSETPAGGNDFNCPDPNRVVEAAYQVLAKSKFAVVKIDISPDKGDLNPSSELSWTAVAGTVVYQLQVFRQLGQQPPVFVTGMLLPQHPQQTTFSKPVTEKLTAGKAYQWRINALNPQGQVIGQSPFVSFIYTAE